MTSLRKKAFQIIGFSFLFVIVGSTTCLYIGSIAEQKDKLTHLGEDMSLSAKDQIRYLIPGLLVEEEYGSVSAHLDEIKVSEKLSRAEVIASPNLEELTKNSRCKAEPTGGYTCYCRKRREVLTITPVILPGRSLGFLIKERLLTAEELPRFLFWPLLIIVGAFLLAFTLIAIRLGLFLQRDVRRPLLNLTNTLEPILRDEHGVEVPHFKVAEIQELADQVAELVKDFDQRRLNAAIAQTTQMLVHDVKRPFVLLKTGLEILQDEKDPDRIKGMVTTLLPDVESALHNVEGLVADIMEISSKTKLFVESVSPEKLIGAALFTAIKANAKSDLTFSYDLAHSYQVKVDSHRAPRIFSNIVENAIEAMHGIGEVWFRTRDFNANGAEFIVFTIGNSNSQIATEDIPKIFSMFFTKGKRSGTGLGLAIVQKIVTEHGGKIWCANIPDKGVEFHFTLPRSDIAAPAKDMANLPKRGVDFFGIKGGL